MMWHSLRSKFRRNWKNFVFATCSIFAIANRPIQRKNRGLLAVITGIIPILTIYLLFFAWHSLPRYSKSWNSSPVSILFSSPRYLAVNEVEELRIAIINRGTEPVNVSFNLRENNSAPIFIENNGTSFFFEGIVRESEQVEQKVQIFIPYDFSSTGVRDTLNEPINLVIQGSFDNSPYRDIGAISLTTMPVPWARTLLGVFFSMFTGVFLWFVKELWNINKEVLNTTR